MLPMQQVLEDISQNLGLEEACVPSAVTITKIRNRCNQDVNRKIGHQMESVGTQTYNEM
jgi:hypothetical protein